MISSAKKGTVKSVWKESVEADLMELTEALHRASREAYVTAKNLQESRKQTGAVEPNVWNFASALFFSFTTMATIDKFNFNLIYISSSLK